MGTRFEDSPEIFISFDGIEGEFFDRGKGKIVLQGGNYYGKNI